jgi:hypothetical protein
MDGTRAHIEDLVFDGQFWRSTLQERSGSRGVICAGAN